MDRQYENIMFALSTLIALAKRQNPPPPVLGISYNEIEQQAERRLESEAEKIFQNLTGNESSREKDKTDFLQEAAREVEEQRKNKDAERARFEEEERARREKIKNEELAKKQAAEERSRNMRVTDTDFLNGDRHEYY